MILDLGLPDLDGLTVLRSLRETDSTTPVIILTARDGARETVEGLDAGADDYITKPFRLEVLLARYEFAVAENFFRHPDEVLSREQILNAVWGYFHDPGSNLIDVYVGSLRKKLGDGLIETVRGQGYRLRM